MSVLETESIFRNYCENQPIYTTKNCIRGQKDSTYDSFETLPTVAQFINWSNHWVINLTMIDSRHCAEIIGSVIIYLEKTDIWNNLLEPTGTIKTCAKVFLESSERKGL